MAGILETKPEAAQNDQKVVFFGHFSIHLKTPYDSNQFFYSHYTLYGGHFRAMTSRSYYWELRNKAKIDQETDFWELFQYFKNCRDDSNEISYSPSTPYQSPLCAMASK